LSKIGWFHFVIANVAIIAGAYNLIFTKKGTRLHRQIGWVYIGSMVLANVTALTIYRLFGGFGPFHFFAIISLVAITGASLSAVKARQSRLAKDKVARERWIGAHYHWVNYSYVGLMAALVSEAAARTPFTRPGPGGSGASFAIAVSLATMGVFAFGAWLIRRKLSAAVKPFKAEV
jgi:uncharacterized membrane protein